MSVPSPDAILHLATLHLLSQAGFASTSQAAGLSLTSVVAQYFKLIAKSSIDRAILAGRNKPGALDVVESLKELGHGFGLEELHEYGLDHAGEMLEGDGLDLLGDYLEDGLPIDEPIAELKLVSRQEAEASAELEEASDPGNPEGPEIKDEPMDVDDVQESKPSIQGSPVQRMRFRSPDYSWLPPRPDVHNTPQVRAVDLTANDTEKQKDTLAISESVAAPSSIADRYRTRVPFASSSLGSQAIYETPLPQPTRRTIAPPSTSLPHLIQTYNDTRNEMSVAIRPNGFRLQALDLLRRQIAAPDGYGPDDSLVAPDVVPGPRISPIAVPPHPVSINPSQQGILSQLVHSIHSANLPPELRERLTSLRPPLAQKRDGQSLTYGPGIRGADQAALLKHQGKPAEEKDEVYAFATWDSGPRGQEKFSRGTLPRDKKVIKFVEGDEFPRQQEKRKSVEVGAGESTPAPRTTLRLKLGDSVSPAPPSSAGQNGPSSSAKAEPPLATPGGTTIKLRLPGSQEPRSVSPAGTSARVEDEGPRGTPAEEIPKFRISTRSPLPQPSDRNGDSGTPAPAQGPSTPAESPAQSRHPPSDVDVAIDRKPSPSSLHALPTSAMPSEPSHVDGAPYDPGKQLDETANPRSSEPPV